MDIPQQLKERISATQAQQAADDALGVRAATATLPGPLLDVWAPVPDIEVGPYKVRRLVDGDFVRLAALGHKLNSFTAVSEWLTSPEPSGPEAWLLNWMMTRPVAEVKAAMTEGPAAVRAKAEAAFDDASGIQLALVMKAIVEQLAIYLGTRIEYKPNQVEGENSSPPPSYPQS